ncbi:MAG: hypothetical protein C0594_08450 [Marinilabiliales bacterium]|nr:MAG: hypothetical protein C0594_08450 [Marinilabiliales bacterium]
MIKKTNFILFLFLSVIIVRAQKLDVSLYSDYSIKSFVLTPVEGKYLLFGDSVFIDTLRPTDIIHLSLDSTKISVKSLDEIFLSYTNVEIRGVEGITNVFKIKPVVPTAAERIYTDGLFLHELNGRILILNRVKLENYVAGVVETEGGSKASKEYYKTQAILCRTYALENWHRHELEGFNLCDGVHCQAYKSKCKHNPEIQIATEETKGLVIVDTSMTLITAAFHSNSGGYTANSEDVWVLAKPYLRSVRDEYWSKGRNAHWSKEIEVDQWKRYLKSYGFNLSGNETAQSFAYQQKTRDSYYRYAGDKLELKTIRYDWRLKSTFFDLVPRGNKLVIEGRGYGHGVGLSQEGAMRMSDMGFPYDKIIKYYYKNVYIVNTEAIDFFKSDSLNYKK